MGYVLVVIKSGLFFGCVFFCNVIDLYLVCFCVVLDVKYWEWLWIMIIFMLKFMFFFNFKDVFIILIFNNYL